MKTIGTIMLLAMITLGICAASQEVAIFTGRAESVTTISGRQAWNCEYRVRGNYTFWKLFTTYCPATISVQ